MLGDPARQNLKFALARVTVCAGLVLAVAVTSAGARGANEQSVIGRTWPIAEPDAMTEIEARAAGLPNDLAARSGPRTSWSAMQSASLGVAEHTKVRAIVPFYTLETEIRLPDGTLLYPKGFTFNPLLYVSLPQRLIVVHARDLGWALKAARPADFILVATQGSKDGAARGIDAIDLTERSGRAVFILEEAIKTRLSLTVAPVIVSQKGQRIELSEVRLDRPAVRRRP